MEHLSRVPGDGRRSPSGGIRIAQDMISGDEQERVIAETAYSLRVLGCYGSQSKAVTALLNRRAMSGVDRQSATNALDDELALLDRTEVLVKSVLQRAERSYHPQLTQEQFDAGTDFINESLATDFPHLSGSIEYMIAMLWHMPRVR